MSSGEQCARDVRFCEVGNCNISLTYETFGDPTDPAVLLIMGLNAQMIVWPTELCATIARSGPYFVIRFDNRDVGHSTKLDHLGVPSTLSIVLPITDKCCGKYKGYSLVDMAHDALALLDYLKISKAHIVGSSMGGMIAQYFCIHHPDRAITMTCVMSTSEDGTRGQSLSTTKNILLMKPKSDSMEDLIDFQIEFGKKILFVGTRGHQPGEYETLTRSIFERTTYRNGRQRHTYAVRHYAAREEALGRLRVPTLVVHGKNDQMITVSHGIRLARLIPGASLLLLDNMGHYVSRGVQPKIVEAMNAHFKKFS